MPIKTYNEHLNASYDAEKTFQRWSEYRMKLSAFMGAEQGLEGEVAIIGAGHLNDVDLGKWGSGREHIILLDIDQKSMEKGLVRQAYSHPVALHALDLTGLDQAQFFDELSVLLTDKDISGVERYLKQVQSKPQLPLEKESLDVLIITPIYTQLILQQFLDLVIMTDNQASFDQLTEAVLQFLVRLIDAVNGELLTLLKPKGVCIAWSDIMEYTTDHPDYVKLLESPQSSEDIRASIADYESQYGTGVGSYGIQNLLEQLADDNDLQEEWFTWPFEDERHLLVKAILGRKK